MSDAAGKKKFGRQMEVLRRFVTGKSHRGSTMRYNPFNLFRTKTVAIEEDPENKQQLYNIVCYTHLQSLRQQQCLEDNSTPNSTATPPVEREQKEGLSTQLRERRECGTTVQDIMTARNDGVDNTGNFHWPAEEVLAHYLLNLHEAGELKRMLENHAAPSRQKEMGKESVSSATSGPAGILELGAGFGLAGLFTASLGYETVVSDGNSGVVKNLAENIKRLGLDKKDVETDKNRSAASTSSSARVIPWQDSTTYMDLFEAGRIATIVGADCLFFEAFHKDLAQLLCHFFLLNANGVVLFVAPTRGNSLENFVAIMKDAFAATSMPLGHSLQVDIEQDVDSYMKSQRNRLEAAAAAGTNQDVGQASTPEFNPDRHYPMLVRLHLVAAATPA